MNRLLLRSAVVLVAACSHSNGDATPAASAAATKSIIASAAPPDSISQKADAGRIAGADTTSALWVIMASDFQCPFCKQWHDASFAGVMDYARQGKIRLAFINMPLSMHPNAMAAAEAAMCAAVQNEFWPMHDALFASQERWGPMSDPSAAFDTLARTAGVDMAQWTECVKRHSTAALIIADRDRMRRAGVQLTPTFFVDGKMLRNGRGISAGAGADVRRAIDSLLAASYPASSSSRRTPAR